MLHNSGMSGPLQPPVAVPPLGPEGADKSISAAWQPLLGRKKSSVYRTCIGHWIRQDQSRTGNGRLDSAAPAERDCWTAGCQAGLPGCTCYDVSQHGVSRHHGAWEPSFHEIGINHISIIAPEDQGPDIRHLARPSSPLASRILIPLETAGYLHDMFLAALPSRKLPPKPLHA
ncbi:hypothetical protein JX265_001865 [Neoarthrinium moseri]|uniref:Uncharacterized protein n=1 Tax=Neoarthrinium moseri TaxID=1658444 RepID=A0A9Q0AR30_9PEZI|nr:hypothetical protein JX265_001865 [Neoarthrinium moseri]